MPETVCTKLIDESKYLTGIFKLDETQAALVERALFRGAGILKEEMESC